MRYDLDMFSTLPEEVRREFQGQLNDLGVGHLTGSRMALFRDPATAEALQSADPQVQQLFFDAGFGLNCMNSGVPEGRFLAHDAHDHERCVLMFSKLFMERKDELSGLDWAGFNPYAFIMAANEAQPINEATLPREKKQRSEAKTFLIGLVILLGSSLIVAALIVFLLKTFVLS